MALPLHLELIGIGFNNMTETELLDELHDLIGKKLSGNPPYDSHREFAQEILDLLKTKAVLKRRSLRTTTSFRSTLTTRKKK
jgi:hypothetical protein